MANHIEKAVFGGGCFWCTEAVYQEVCGVLSVRSGYAGGTTGTTGHAEVIEVTYDPDAISYRDLLRVFFSTHDPTTMNRQGNDVGTQYRSIILATSDDQQKIAHELIAEMSEKKLYSQPITTEVKPLDMFYPAEEYHQNYYKENAAQPYCQLVISPKLEKFRKNHASLVKRDS